MAKYTILGARGFIGSEFVRQLQQGGHEIFIPKKNDPKIFENELGTVIYAIGEGDCTKNAFNVLEANTNLLSQILQFSQFEQLIYISSTRVYLNQTQSHESCQLYIDNEDSRRLFNLSKLLAEELCLKSKKNCLIIRPSNVYGLAINSSLFLPSITRDAIQKQEINMYVNQDYSKDYISVDDVVSITLKLTNMNSKLPKIINLASGENISAKDIATVLVKKTKCNVVWHQVINQENFPIIDNSLMKSLLPDFKTKSVLSDLEHLIYLYKLSIS